jgi:hypothetical protein
VPPDVTCPLPEPAAGALLGLKPLVPEEELAEPELALDWLAEGSGAAGRAGTDWAGLDVRVAAPDGGVLPGAWADPGRTAPDGGILPGAWAVPGRIRVTAPAVMKLAVVTAVVTERILAWPRSLARTARRTLSRFALFMLDTAGEVMQGW